MVILLYIRNVPNFYPTCMQLPRCALGGGAVGIDSAQCVHVYVNACMINSPFLLLVFLRKCDETVSYHLYIVTRYLWVLVPHIIRICL